MSSITRSMTNIRSSAQLTKMALFIVVTLTYLIVTAFMVQVVFTHLYLIVYVVPDAYVMTSKVVAYVVSAAVVLTIAAVLLVIVTLTKRYVQLSAKKPDSGTPS